MASKLFLALACTALGFTANEGLHRAFLDSPTINDLRVVRLAAEVDHTDNDLFRIVPAHKSLAYMQWVKKEMGKDARVEICTPYIPPNNVFDPKNDSNCQSF